MRKMIQPLRVLLLGIAAWALCAGQAVGGGWKDYNDGKVDWQYEEIEAGKTCRIKPKSMEDLRGHVVIPGKVAGGIQVKEIYMRSFADNKLISRLDISEGIEVIGEGAFFASNIKQLVIYSGVKEIGPAAFSACDRLETLYIPETVASIGSQAFTGCKKLKEVQIPSGLKWMGYRAGQTFASCNSLNAVYWLPVDKVMLVDVNLFPQKTATLYVRKGASSGVEDLKKYFKDVVELEHVVTFANSDGVTQWKQLVGAGQKASEPPAPVKEGYTFAGWYKAGETEKYDFQNTAVTGDITLHMQWEGAVPPSTKYTLAIAVSGEGTVKITKDDANGAEVTDGAEVKEGDRLFIVAAPKDATTHELESLMVNGEAHASGTVFTVGTADVKVEAKFREIPVTKKYRLTIAVSGEGTVKITKDDANGAEVTDGAEVKEGDRLFIAVTLGAAQELESLTVNKKEIKSGSVFTVGRADVMVEAKFRKVTPPTKYTLTIVQSADGEVKVTKDTKDGEEVKDGAEVREGDRLFIEALPRDGFEADAIIVNTQRYESGRTLYEVKAKESVRVEAKFKAVRKTAVESLLLAGVRVVGNLVGEVLVLEGAAAAKRVEVYSLAGVLVYTRALRGESRVEVAASRWATGVYVLRVVARDGARTLRFVKR